MKMPPCDHQWTQMVFEMVIDLNGNQRADVCMCEGRQWPSAGDAEDDDGSLAVPTAAGQPIR